MFQFERVTCVSLGRRPDRWERFLEQLPSDWPFRDVERFDAVDGSKCPAPHWWRVGNGAWGCYKSHLNILEECLQQGIESCLFLEDDAVCEQDFANQVSVFFDSLPEDWGMVYLGGQHLWPRKNPPVRVNENVYIPFNVNRTHAFGVRGQKAMRVLYRHLNEARDWKETHHIDHHLGRLHERRELPVYCPNTWLIGQAEGRSNISGKQCDQRFFPPAVKYGAIHSDFVGIIGLPNSGADEVAMMLHDMGFHAGHQFMEPVNEVGVSGRPIGLTAICESALPFPSSEIKCWEGTIRCGLLDWIRPRTWEAKTKNTLAVGYVPQLAVFGETLESTLGDQLKTIFVNRPMHELQEEIRKQYPYRDPALLNESLAFYESHRERFRAKTQTHCLEIEHSEIIESLASVRSKLEGFLEAAVA